MMRGAARGLTRALGTCVVFCVAAVVGLALHLGLAPARRSVVQRVDGALEPLFAGKLTIERIGALGLTHADDVDAHVDAPGGACVVRATGVTAHVSTGALLRSLLGGDILVSASDVSVANAEVNLDADEAGIPWIARAFLPRSPSPPGGPPGRGFRVTLASIHLKHTTVRGKLGVVPPIDGDLDDTDARLFVSTERLAVDVDRTRVAVRSLPGGQDARGAADAHLTLPLANARDLGLRVAFQGTLGSIASRATFTLAKDTIDVVVDAPEVSPDQGRSVWPPWPLVVPTAMHAEAHGALPRLAVRGHASASAATLDVAGALTVAPRLQAALHVDAKGVDVRSLIASGPISDVAASGDVTFAEQPSGAVEGRAVIDVPGGRVGPTSIPSIALTANATLAPSSAAGSTATAKAVVRIAGAPTVITARLTPKKGSLLLSFVADANAPDLRAVAWPGVATLGGVAGGRAVVHADGAIDLATNTIEARGSVAGEDLVAYGVEAAGARVEARATGRLLAPTLDLQVAGSGIEGGRLRCSSMRAGVRMAVDEGATLHDLDVEVHSGEQEARLRAALVRLGDRDVRVEGAEIDGFGAPLEATVRWSPGRLFVNARSGPIDLTRVARFTNVSVVQGGRVSLDVDASASGGSADGRVTFDVSHAAFATFKDANAHVEATLHGRQAAGRVTASVADIGSIDVQSPSVHLGEGGLLSASTWRRSWGSVTMNARVDLPKLMAVVPAGTLPFRRVQGQLDMTARADLDSAGDPSPDFEWTATTTGLVIVGGTESVPWRLEGLDPTLHLKIDGDTAATALEAQLQDTAGPIFKAVATSTAVPYAALFSGDGWIDALRAMPFDARVWMPSHGLDSLPMAWGLNDFRGQLKASVEWHGAAILPAVRASASLARGRVDRAASSLPVDLSFAADYDGAHATATLQATDKDKVVLDASARADARATDLLDGLAGAPVPWTASGQAKLDALPLRSISFLGDRQVRGRASGEFVLSGLHDDARATASLTVDGLKVGDIACKAARVQASVDGHTFDASARVEQADGFVDARAHAGARWGRELKPSLDPSQPGEASLSARQLRAGLLLPFVSGLFAELDGRVDADARVALDAGSQAVRPQGTIELSDGNFELVTLGGEFSGAAAKVMLTPDGLIRVENAVAHGVSGRIEAAASARIAGLAFAGGRATVQVPKKYPIPVVFDGVQVGTMDGHFDIAADEAADRKSLDVTVGVPSLHVQLPVSRTHDVQALGDLEGVTTGVLRGPDDFLEVPLDATFAGAGAGPPPKPIKIAIRLGHDVEVSRGDDLDVRLEGQPTITIAEDVRVTGQIRLLRGTIDIYGKPFEIEKGAVTFVGDDPSNPQVVLTAGWTAVDGTRVYADFVGPLKTGKVTLRSEPALASQNDILSLILFGTTEAGTSEATQQASTVAGAAGGAATAPINRALSGVNRALDNLGLAGGITTKIDTSQTNPRPEVELQIARDISLQVAWVLGVPPPGTNPDTTLVTLNWRFLRNWSLETTVGDAGTSILDLIWQHRY